MNTNTNRQLCVGLSLSPTWHRQNNTTTSTQASTQISSTDIYTAGFYINLAKQAEEACLDFVFKPDSFSLQLPKGSDTEFIQPTGTLDPSIIATTIATHTKRIGIVTTISTTFNDPFITARQLMSMNWISQGRIGWNVVTSLDGQENFGLDTMPDADTRYARASEFVSVVQKLWHSFQLRTLNTPDNTPPAKNANLPIGCHKIHHSGNYFHVSGPLNIPAFPKAKIAIFQAGASVAGKQFATCIADAIFAATPNKSCAIKLREELLSLGVAQGRKKPLKVLPGLYFFIRDDKTSAFEAYLQAHAHLDKAYRLQKIIDIIGVDFTDKDVNDIITIDDLPALSSPVRSRTHAALLRHFIQLNTPSLSELLTRPEVIHSGHWVIWGTAKQIANEIIDWLTAGAMDGFIALPGDEESLQCFFSNLMPTLVELGYFRSTYEQDTLSGRLYQL